MLPRLLFALVSAAMVSPVALAADPRFAAASLDRKLDLTYATVDGRKLQLDLVVPKTPGPHPLVVCLHGGAWKFGSRKDLSNSVIDGLEFTGGGSLLDALAVRGFAAASVSYRLAPKDKFPTQIADAKTALRFLKANAKALNLDPDRVAAMGFSAGGHLAALLGLTPGVREFAGSLYPEQSDAVKCVVNFFGPTDLTLFTETPGIEKAYFVPWLGVSSEAKPEAYKKASPIEYARKESVPVLTIHGTADIIVPFLHAERFHEKLLAAGAKSVLLPVKWKGHGWGGETAVETTDAAAKFLREHLGAK